MKLPSSVREIAEVIGHERALYLVGKLPRCHPASRKAEAVVVYVPTLKRLKPDHILVQILGWQEATKMCRAFGGEVLQPGNCREIYRRFRDASIVQMRKAGVPVGVIAEWMDITPQAVRSLASKNLQMELPEPANDNAPILKRGAGRGWTNNRKRAG